MSLTRLEDLSPEQQRVVGSWGKSLAVLAGAGSGKTTTLVIKCEELLKRNPEARFAAVSFTERSAADLTAKLSSRLDHLGTLSPHWVMTIHGLCHSVLREFPAEAGFDGEETLLSEPESRALWEVAISAFWFQELQGETEKALERLLARESRDSLHGLLRRARELAPFGALEFLEKSEDADSRALGGLARWVIGRYEGLKKRRGVIDFNDLERAANAALEHESVRRAYHARFDLVLVDEFQDTNPLQAAIIRRFCRADASNLCVVGDPKQSIYRFRDADVGVFEEFCSSLEEPHALSRNFRSRPAIIDYVNELCSRAFASSAQSYEPLVPQKVQVEGEQAVIRVDLGSEQELGRWILSEVRKGVRLEDMALLLRKIRGNEKWLRALVGAGVPIAVGSGGLFWEDARVREMAALLRWWDNPAHALSAATFLRAPWVGIDDETLDEWVKQDPTFVGPFFSSNHPLAQSLAPLRGRLARPAQLLEALLVDEKVERELGAPWLGLWHRVEELSSRGFDFHAVALEVSEAIQEGRRERDVPPPKNQGQLQVLTLHSSKGLEFPHVILVDLGAKPRAPEMPLLFWDRKQGAFLGVRDSEGERLGDKDPSESRWRAMEKQKNLAESKRLFYVAMTRAQERLVLACPERQLKESDADPFGTDDWREWIENGSEVPRLSAGSIAKEAIVPLAAPEAAPVARPKPLPREAFPLRRPRHSVTEWNLLSRCPRAYDWKYIHSQAPAQAPAPAHQKSGLGLKALSSQELGSRVHSCLERDDHEGLRALELEVGETSFRAEPLIEWSRSSPLMKTGNEVWTELAFEVPIGAEVLVGSMDRVVRERGARSIIDFKITAKPKTDDALLEAYATQLGLYSFALGALLGEEGRAHPINAYLVNISPASIRVIEAPASQLNVSGLAAQAARIISGEGAHPRPGPLCGQCEFRADCPEGRAFSKI